MVIFAKSILMADLASRPPSHSHNFHITFITPQLRFTHLGRVESVHPFGIEGTTNGGVGRPVADCVWIAGADIDSEGGGGIEDGGEVGVDARCRRGWKEG